MTLGPQSKDGGQLHGICSGVLEAAVRKVKGGARVKPREVLASGSEAGGGRGGVCVDLFLLVGHVSGGGGCSTGHRTRIIGLRISYQLRFDI